MTFWGKLGSHSVGLDIGSSTLKLAQLKRLGKGFGLTHLGYASIPTGTVVDGDILDAYTLEQALKELFSKQAGISKEISLAISGSGVLTKKITLPKLSEHELDNQLSVIGAQYIPFPIEDVQLDYQLLPQPVREDQKMDLILVAAKKKGIESLVRVLEAADLKPISIETTASALGTLFSYAVPQEETAALLHMGAGTTLLTLVKQGIPLFQRSFMLGGNTVTEKLQDRLKMSYSEAETLKMSGPQEKHLPQETVQSIEGACHLICDEVTQSLRSLMDQWPDTGLEKIYLSGGPSKHLSLMEWLGEKTGLKTVPLPTFNHIESDSKKWTEATLEDLRPFFPVALGLAMRE